MQDAYTIICEANSQSTQRNAGVPFRLVLSVLNIQSVSKQALHDFQEYIVGFEKVAGWEFSDNPMGDENKCGALYCNVGVRNAGIVHQYMSILAGVKQSITNTDR